MGLGTQRGNICARCLTKFKSFSFFQGPTYSSLTSPPRLTMISSRSVTGPWIPARWLADSAARMSRRPSSPHRTRRPFISTVIILRTNQASGSSTRVRNRPVCTHEQLWVKKEREFEAGIVQKIARSENSTLGIERKEIYFLPKLLVCH